MACPFFDVIAKLDHCTSRYITGGIHIESYLVLVSSCNSYVVINRSVMIIIIRALPKKRPKKRKAQKKEKEKKEQRKKLRNKERRGIVSILYHTCASK